MFPRHQSRHVTPPVSGLGSLPDEVFDLVSGYAQEDFALNLDRSKRSMVFRRLSPRVKSLGLSSFEAYADKLRRDPDERGQLLSLLTTNLTGFYREMNHFELLSRDWLPRLIATAKEGRPVRLWSAACSSGQEPYSLALSLLEAFPDVCSYDVKILATDIDPVILETAKAGRYKSDALSTVPKALLRSCFTEDKRDPGWHQVSKEARSLVSFGQLNLVGDWPMSGSFDVIFCRNVAIYFAADVQRALWKRLADRLKPGALFCIGHSERITGPASELLTSLGKTAYARK